MILRLLSVIFLVIFALLGTVAGNALRLLFDRPYRKPAPNADNPLITAVITNSLMAALIALFSGARLFTAFVGGAVLTAILGDRLDRDPFPSPPSSSKKKKKPPRHCKPSYRY